MSLTPLPPGFLPLASAAAWAGVSPRTLRRWLALGLPRYQASPRSKVLIQLVDIQRFLTRRQEPAESTGRLDRLVDEVAAGLRGP